MVLKWDELWNTLRFSVMTQRPSVYNDQSRGERTILSAMPFVPAPVKSRVTSDHLIARFTE